MTARTPWSASKSCDDVTRPHSTYRSLQLARLQLAARQVLPDVGRDCRDNFGFVKARRRQDRALAGHDDGAVHSLAIDDLIKQAVELAGPNHSVQRMPAVDYAKLVRQERAAARAATPTKKAPVSLPAPVELRGSKKLESVLPDVWYAADFISSEEEAQLLCLDGPWIEVRGRRLLRFGGPAGEKGFRVEPLPAFIQAVADAASAAVGRPLNHCLVNSYAPGEGIMAHTDGPAYEHVTATLSCGQDRLMYFRPRLRPSQVGEATDAPLASVLLRRRSLVVFSGDAYINQTHGIDAVHAEVVGGNAPCANLDVARAANGDTILVRNFRLSFTLRHAKEVG